jgi:HSP20 family protein
MMLVKRNRPSLLESFFNDDFFTESLLNTGFERSPKSNWEETDDNYILEMALPGMTKEDVNVEIADGYLTISSKIEEKSENSWYHQSFSKSIYLPDNVKEDDIKPSMKDGILKIEFGKEEPKKPKKKIIEIQ